jgi:zinc protease
LEVALKAEINKLQHHLISTEELQRIKAQVLASDTFQKDSSFYQAMEIGTLETAGLGWQKAGEYVTKINQVTAEQVRDVAQKYLIEDHLSIAYLEPQTINASTEKKGVK